MWGGGSGLIAETVNAPFDITHGASPTGSGALYDPRADAWTPLPMEGAPSARVGATAVWSGRELLVFGGYDEAALATGGRYDAATNAWRAMSGSCAPLARFGHTAVWTGSAMLVWGGRDKRGDHYQIGGEYDPITDSWRQTGSGGAPAPRQYHVATWTGSELLVWGGEAASRSALLDGGGRYRP